MPVVRRPPFFFLLVCALVLTAGAARADTLVLQDGSRVHGRLESVAHGWVEFQPLEGDEPGAPQRVAVAEVRSIEFDDDAAVATTRGASGGGDRMGVGEPGPGARERRTGGARAVTVSAAQRWTDTGLEVAAGDVVSFSTAGTVNLGDDHPVGPEGDLAGAAAAPRRLLPDRPAGALIGRIGMSPDDTFFIGAERLPFRVRTSGRLYLGVNDGDLDDDTGAFQVAVSPRAER